MKRVVLSGAALLAALVLPGCPVYPEERGCFSHDECPAGAACHEAGYCVLIEGRAGSSSVAQCDEPSDCRANETCGKDRRCHVGSCRFHDCVSGFECQAMNGVWGCTSGNSSGGTGGTSGYGADADVVDSSQPDANTDAAGSGGTGTDGGDSAVPDGGEDDASSDSASDAARDSASDAPRDSASDARDSASDAPPDSPR